MSTWGDGIYWDVAEHPGVSHSHVILRDVQISMCGIIARQLGVTTYHGSHNSGAQATCPRCRAILKKLRDAREMTTDIVDPEQVLRTVRRLIDGSQPRDLPGAIAVIDSALKGLP